MNSVLFSLLKWQSSFKNWKSGCLLGKNKRIGDRYLNNDIHTWTMIFTWLQNWSLWMSYQVIPLKARHAKNQVKNSCFTSYIKYWPLIRVDLRCPKSFKMGFSWEKLHVSPSSNSLLPYIIVHFNVPWQCLFISHCKTMGSLTMPLTWLKMC